MAKKKLKKLKLWAYKDDNFSAMAQGLQQPMTVSINPDSYKRSFKPLRAKNGTKLADGGVVDPTIVDPPPERFQMELWFDGTGAIPDTLDVVQEIETFKKFALYYNGDIHSTNYIKLEWGGKDGLIFKGQLEEFSVDYTLFDQTGKPLRAKGSATFVQSLNDAMRESLKKKSSPDLTHIRVVQAGDNLPLMCYRIYGDPAYYVQVARANRLGDVMTLEPGRRIYFPPLEQ
jgi:hypothetical protein